MNRALLLLAAALVVLAPRLARAADDDDESDQRLDDDQAQPRHSSDDDSSSSSDDDEAPRRPKHHRHRDGDTTAEEELSDEPDPSMQKMAREDDPRIGLGVEAALSLDLIDKSYGPGTQNTGAFGLRVNWAPGVLWTDPEDEFWRYALLVEASWDHASYSDGTKMVNTSTALNYFNVRGLFGYPVQKLLLFYGALGPGFTLENVSYNVQGASTPLSGAKFNIAYGLGARLNFQANDRFALVSRLELLRYRRGYMNDTFMTFTVGGAF